MPKSKVIAVVGPTASGKSALGIWLAKQIKKGACGAEIISADSRQVYKGLDIGTGKVTRKEMAGIPHHLLSVVSPKKQFSVDDFVKLSEKALSYILENRRIPIVVGGTGLYIDTLLGRMSYPEVSQNPTLRKRLETKTPAQLFAMLQKTDPARAQTIDPHNPRRLVRALEVARAIGASPTPKELHRDLCNYDVLWLGLSPAPDKQKANIHKRLLSRMQTGMVAEARRLHKQGLTYKRMDGLGLEYRYLSLLLQNKITKAECMEQLEGAIRQYAKRQMTWFKRNKDIVWVRNKTHALKLAKAFLSR